MIRNLCSEARTKFLLLHLKVGCSEPWHIAVLQVLEEITRVLQEGIYVRPPVGY
jgi:hypothetical protein